MHERGAAPPLPGYTIYDPIDPFENLAGPFHWRRLEDGSHHFVVRALARHCNRHGIVHGGMMMTMIDLAMVACSKQDWEEAVVTVSQNVEFVAAGREGELIEAAGECIRRGNSIAFVRGQVFVADRVLLNASAVLKPLKSR